MADEATGSWERLLREWRTRLARLRGMLGRRRTHSSWMWEIRAKVLNYLVTRYGLAVQVRRTEPGDAEPARDWPRAKAGSERREPRFPAGGIGKAPRTGDQLRALLEDIHRLNSYNNAH